MNITGCAFVNAWPRIWVEINVAEVKRMSLTKRFAWVSVLIALVLASGMSGRVAAQQSQLGSVDFPTSGSVKAQEHFLRGVAALHSFWFEEALDEFRESTKIEPGFLMGYWGEAMALNHPLWSEQDTDAARKVLEKIKDTSRVTPKERAFIDAVRVLYGEGDKLTRDKAYCAAVEKIYRDYPDDLEAASFYALSLLGTVRPEDRGFRRQALAGAIAMEVFKKNPNHPGAAHYIIHAFDDPEHAILALPAARRYAEIAPAAHHARHMPAHIFLQLGMWPEAARSNESAWAVSEEWVKRKNLSISLRDYHSLHWLLYVYLQQGRYGKADELLEVMRKAMSESASDNKLRPGYYANNYATMAATFIVETEHWDLAAKLFPTAGAAAGDEASGEHAGHGGGQKQSDSMVSRRSSNAQVLPAFVRGMAAGMTGSEGIDAGLAALGSNDAAPASNSAKAMEIRRLELSAIAASAKRNYDDAIGIMKKATALEEDMAPPSGPPSLIKPSHELFGEILLRADRPEEAAKEFETCLLRQPNRARSLLGAARAAAKRGDARAALEFYSKFSKQWRQADPDLPELREAQDYLKQARAR
jgi:tetratricopeptide (TPR) repeat protein